MIHATVNARWLVVSAALLLWPVVRPASALQEGDEPVEVAEFPAGVEEIDRVVAVVGDTVILISELRTTMFQLRSEGARVPAEDSPEWLPFARQVLMAQIDALLFLQEAKRAGVTPDEERVDQAADDFYEQQRSQFSTDEEMMQAVEGSGMNMLQYRQLLRGMAEAEMVRQDYRIELERRSDLPPVIVEESEIAAYFEEYGADQPPRPALVSFNQLVVTPTPSGEARDSALARTLLVQSDLAAGEDFGVLARRYSDDEATRDQGGELGWMTREGLVKPFSDAAWRGRPGQTIGPIQTQFGLHFIKIERQRGAERFIRHILLRPEIKDADIEEARTLAVEIADSLAAGVDPEQLMGYFRGKLADEDIRVDNVTASSVASRFSGDDATALTNPTEGKVYGPLEWERGGPTEFVLIHVLTYRPEGPMALDDVRDAIRQSIRTQKQIELVLSEIRANTFIDLKL